MTKPDFAIRRFVKGKEIRLPIDKAHLLFLTAGKIEVVEAEGSHVCLAGEMVLIPYDRNYQITALDDTDMLIHIFTTSQQACDSLSVEAVWQIMNRTDYRFHTLDMTPPVLQFVESVMFYLNHGMTCDYLNQAKVSELFLVCRFFYSLEEIGRFFYPIFYGDFLFSNLVKANHAQAKNVRELAELCGYSYANFKKVFAAHFDLPPYQWMAQQKSFKIKARLLDKSIPIKNIATEFGFVDQSHLNAFCRRHFNSSPAQIRSAAQA